MSFADHDRAGAPALPDGVALTAAAMAQERAVESERPDGIVDDPWARRLVAAALAATPVPTALAGGLREGATLGDMAAGMAGYVPLRTRWIDDEVLAATARGAPQVVVLGAGLDTRALRLPWPVPVTVLTVDQPAVVAFTRHVLGEAVTGASVRWTPVPVDLRGPWEGSLSEAGFEPGVATVWVIEGLLMYLPPDQVDTVLTRVRELSAPGSTVLADHAHPSVHDGDLFDRGRQSLQDNGSPLLTAVAEPVAWYAQRGWRGHVVDVVALAHRVGRPVPPALDEDRRAFWFTEATPS